MQELLQILTAMTAKKDQFPDRRELFLDLAERVAKHACGVFGCRSDEVALLVLTADQRHLRFAAPRKLTDLGSIPLTKRDSIAVGVFLRGAGEAHNNVPLVRHVAFFESVKLRDRALPIQKMVTVPIVDGKEAFGVAQISRKGENQGEAGPDFSPADVRKAEDLFRAVAPFLRATLPEKF
jgi:hypothetical protein